MKSILSLIILLFFFTKVYPQYIDKKTLPLAVEVWSEPEKLDTLFGIDWKYEDYPSLTQSYDTLYFHSGEALLQAIKLGRQWEISDTILNDPIVRCPTPSRDGKRIYFSAFQGYGGWDLWYIEWQPDSSKWSIPQNMGSEINSSKGEYYFYELTKDTAYIIKDDSFGMQVCLYHFEDENESWAKDTNYYYHPIGYWGNIFGLSITEDRKKMYFATYIDINDLNKKDTIQGIDLLVCYKNSLTNDWGEVFTLNINSFAVNRDTILHRYYFGGGEEYPWISPDGKAMVFSSNRHTLNDPIAWEKDNTKPDLYISYLLVDENGDTVTAVKNNEKETFSFQFYQNYPNPFNPETTIEYSLNGSLDIKILLYDAIGKKVSLLFEGERTRGEYQIKLNAEQLHLASGVYYCTMTNKLQSKTIKLLYLK